MRKKFIAVYALMAVLALGSTTLTSCVDDTESATVTAMRDARLRQLQALADQEEAQAKIDAITAQMKEATSEAELAVLKAKYEKELAFYQQQKALAEQEMATGLNNHQAALYEDYTNAIDKVNLLAGDIAKESLELIKLKADSSTAAAYAKEQIIEANRNIAYQEALKKNYEALAAVDFEELKAKKAEADAAQKEKDKALNLANNSKTEAENAFTNAKADIVRRYVYQETNNNETVTKISETKPTHISDYETLEPTNEVALAAYTLNDLGNSGDITNWRADIATTKKVKVSEESETSINQFEILASTLSQVTRLVESKVKAATDDLGTEGDKSDKNTAWGRHQQLVETLEAAQKAYNDAVKADPKGDHSNLLNRVKDAQEAVDTDLEKERDKFGVNTLLYYQNQAEKAEAIQTKFNEAVAVFNDATKYKAYTDRVAAILAKEGKAKDAAKDAYWSAMQELAIAEANLESITNLIANTLDPETLIAQCDTQIALEKETLAIAEALIYSVNAGGTSASEREAAYADLIENAEKKIEYLEAQKDLQQKMAEQYKSQLEASLNSGSAE
ncbi:hypothetical protein [Phocaeicola coprophilus]|uniref:hypothetical protein n=1 Tax=Phocaeicola coprophilus TaxID=387090 RepID=UPI0040264546